MFSENAKSAGVAASDLLSVMLSPDVLCGIVLDRSHSMIEALDRRIEPSTPESRAEFLQRLIEGMDPAKLEPALSGAFAGTAGRQTISYTYAGAEHLWDVRVVPLSVAGGVVQTVLVAGSEIAPDAVPGEAPDTQTQRLRDLVHGYANLATLSQSSARILTRGTVAPMTRQIADALEAAAAEAEELISGWRVQGS